MPKELLEIKKFHTGTITTPVETDIPLDAASYSLNIDPVAEDGVLRGINNDAYLAAAGSGGVNATSGTALVVGADRMKIISHDNKKDIVYHDTADDKIKEVKDLYGTPTLRSTFSTLEIDGTATLEVNNKEVHIGTGNQGNNYPKWVGYVRGSQFGADVNSNMQIESAELKPPSEFTSFSKVVSDHNKTMIFGYKKGDTYLYKFSVLNGVNEFIAKTSFKFNKIATICKSDLSSEDAIFVLDDIYSHSAFTFPYILYKIDMSSLNVVHKWNVRDWTGIVSSGSGAGGALEYDDIKLNGYFSGDGTAFDAGFGDCYDMVHVYADDGDSDYLWIKNSCSSSDVPMIARATFPALGAYCDFYNATPSLGHSISAIVIDTSDAAITNIVFSASGKTITVNPASGSFAWWTGIPGAGKTDGTDLYTRAIPASGFIKIAGTSSNGYTYKIASISGAVITIDDANSNHPNVTDETHTSGDVTFTHQPFKDDISNSNETVGAFTYLDGTYKAVDGSTNNTAELINANKKGTSSYEFFNSLFKPAGVTNSSSKAWVGLAGQIYVETAADTGSGDDGDAWFQYAQSGDTPSRHVVHNYLEYESGQAFETGEWKYERKYGGAYVALLMREDFEAYGNLDSNAASSTDIDDNGKGALVFISELQSTGTPTDSGHGFSQAIKAEASGHFAGVEADAIFGQTNASKRVGMTGFHASGNDDIGVLTMADTGDTDITSGSVAYSNTFSNIQTFNLPNVSTQENGNTVTKQATESGTGPNSVDVYQPACLAMADSGGLKIHIFNGSITNGLVTSEGWSYGALNSITIVGENNVTITDAGEDSSITESLLDEDKGYMYKASFTYDGYQESPLTSMLAFKSPTGASKRFNFNVALKPSTLSSRITHLNIYVAIIDSTTVGERAVSLYRLLETIPLDGRWLLNDESTTYNTGTPDWESYYRIEITDIGVYGATYDANVGISQEVSGTLPNYALSTQLNNQLFIAKCSHIYLDDAENFIFKSKPYNFDQFDWTRDILRLPTLPTAIAAFEGRIYVFDENNTYRIEPNSFYIEDTYDGVGCSGESALAVTEYGMCFANKNNIYLHDGKFPRPIGDKILRGDTYAWQNLSSNMTPKVMYDSKRGCFLVFARKDSNYYAWAYNGVRDRWDLWDFASTAPRGLLAGKNGELLISTNTGSNSILKNYLGKQAVSSYSENRTWSYTSKQMTLGNDTQDKTFKKFKLTGTPTGALGTNINATIDGASVTESGSLSEFSVSTKKGKKAQISLTGQTNYVDAIGVVFRRRSIR